MSTTDLERVRSDRVFEKVNNSPAPELKSSSNGDVWQEGEWIVAVAEYSEENIGKDTAMKRALEEARGKAIGYSVGYSIMSSSMITDLMSQKKRFFSFSQYTATSSYGRIIKEQEPKKWTQQEIGKDKNGLPIMNYKVTLRCMVQREEGSPDPGFSIRIRLNQYTFMEGDKIEIYIYPTQDCYLTVFNLYEAEDKVIILYPNEFDKNNQCKANKVNTIPNPESGISFRALLLPSKEESSEFIWVIATKKPIDFSAGLQRESAFAYLPTPVAAVQEINKKLALIPLNERTQTSEIIRITKK